MHKFFLKGKQKGEAKGAVKMMMRYAKRKFSSLDHEDTLSHLREFFDSTEDNIQMYLNNVKEAEEAEAAELRR
jgi:succinate dehydrogenase flavin-adding protein (antitoxin of CptAB toxin-antitoxin module)